MNNKKNQICAYCGTQCICEKEHVIARQFFPNEQKYRSNLPQVPSCRKCNGEKQKVEDIAGVYFQFGHDSYASKNVLTNRVARTLQKNKKLATMMHSGLQKKWIQLSSGLIVPGLIIKLPDKVLNDFRTWFYLVAKGLYRYELNNNIPENHELILIKPFEKEQFYIFHSMVLSIKNHQKRAFANNEFQYIYAENKIDTLSLWIYSFKSIEVVSITAGPNCPKSTIDMARKIEWKS